MALLEDYLWLVGDILERHLLLFLSNDDHILAPDASEILRMRPMIRMLKTGILEGVLLNTIDKFGNPAALVDFIQRLVISSSIFNTRTIISESLRLLFFGVDGFVKYVA